MFADSMNTIEAIATRRSMRRFTAQPVPEPIIRELLFCAMQAPSAGNAQPWHFVVIDHRGLLAEALAQPGYENIATPAPLGVLLCGDASLEKYPGFWPQDLSAATQNLLLAAHENGLGAVWTGVYTVDVRIAFCRSKFGIPDGVTPFALVLIGYPDETLEREDRYQSARVHRNRWGE